MARASEKENVIPSRAELFRRLPRPARASDEDQVRERVESVLGEGDWEIEFARPIVGNRSEPTPSCGARSSDWLGEADPGAGLVPMVMPGFSDSHWFRKAFDARPSTASAPTTRCRLAEYAPLIHSADERIAVADLELAARFFADLPPRLLG